MGNVDAVKRYQEKRDSIMLRPSKDDGQTIRATAAAAGQSVQGYILQAVRERMEREKGVTAAEERPGVVIVSAGASPSKNVCSRSTSLTSTDSQSTPSMSTQPQVSIYKRLADLPEEERETAIMGTPAQQEAVKDFAKNMEEKVKKRMGL